MRKKRRTKMAEIPNLDAMDVEKLVQAEKAFRELYQYSLYKKWAIIAREEGDIDGALSYEDDADNVYARIPEEYRW
jgi:hypothetical protein